MAYNNCNNDINNLPWDSVLLKVVSVFFIWSHTDSVKDSEQVS